MNYKITGRSDPRVTDEVMKIGGRNEEEKNAPAIVQGDREEEDPLSLSFCVCVRAVREEEKEGWAEGRMEFLACG